MKKLALFTAATLAIGGVLAGCGSETTSDESVTKSPTTSETTTTPVVFSNDKGEALCPVMGAPMASTENLKFQDYEGKRYYFCCGDCPEKFAADPAKYADGKAMPDGGSM